MSRTRFLGCGACDQKRYLSPLQFQQNDCYISLPWAMKLFSTSESPCGFVSSLWYRRIVVGGEHGAIYQMNFAVSAKWHTSISVYSLDGQTWWMGFPRRMLKRMLLACEMTVVSNNSVGRSWCYSFWLCDDFRKNTPDLLILAKERIYRMNC